MVEGSPAAMRRPDTGPILPEDATVTGILAGKVAIVRSGDANWLTPISTALSSHGARVALVAGPDSGAFRRRSDHQTGAGRQLGS